jgi:hypothetical protein
MSLDPTSLAESFSLSLSLDDHNTLVSSCDSSTPELPSIRSSSLSPTPFSCVWPLNELKQGDQSQLFSILIPNGRLKESGRSESLSSERRHLVRESSARIGLSMIQAFSLRRQLMSEPFRSRHDKYESKLYFRLLSQQRHLLMPGCIGLPSQRLGNVKDQANNAKLFELIVNKYLVDLLSSTSITISIDDGTIQNRPDFLFSSPISLNGHLVHWIECKNFYCAKYFHCQHSDKIDYKCKFPACRCFIQAFKFQSLYGSGALLFSRGFHSDLLDRMPKGILLLDCTPLVHYDKEFFAYENNEQTTIKGE